MVMKYSDNLFGGFPKKMCKDLGRGPLPLLSVALQYIPVYPARAAEGAAPDDMNEEEPLSHQRNSYEIPFSARE
jgi:hypothetical protein